MINDVDDRAFMQEVYQQNERLMYAIALKYGKPYQAVPDWGTQAENCNC